jgi:hypothetical protein
MASLSSYTAYIEVVVAALVRDVASTIGVRDETELAQYLSKQGQHALEMSVGYVWGLDALTQRMADDLQQRIHDEFIDVSWPRCPRHPHHPLWLEDGSWRCTADNVAIAALGMLGRRDGG